ncbi:MAG TPA: L-rhamnose mutarotase [Terriglobales bacterium]|nr:L-rhamnose mutarotase [Terriglobales bacterium]
MTRRYCYTLDLKEDPQLISDYKKHHEKIWPEVASSYRECGVEDMEIYLVGTRMFMIMEVNDRFTFEQKARADATPRLQEWERLMETFQQVPDNASGHKWMPMERIFQLKAQ